MEKRSFFDRKRLGGKSFWEWMELLIVPGVITILAVIAAGWVQQQINDQNAQIEREISRQNAQIQTFIEEQRAQSTSVAAYLDVMTRLLLEEDLLSAEVDSPARAIAQAQTLTVFRELDPEGKRTVLLFLQDANLISIFERETPIVDLHNADLSSADLRNADLRSSSLLYTDLHDANLHSAFLIFSDLRYADLRNADLSGASLDQANLSGANLEDANLSRASLSHTDFSDANLTNANLTGAYGGNPGGLITTEQLEEQGAFLEGATMPDGSKHP